MQKFKPVLILAGTLIIGFVLGFFVSGSVTHHKIQSYMRVTEKEGFVNMIYERIDPSDEQKEQLYPILQKYSQKSNTCLERHKVVIDSLRTELEPFLTDQQMQKLEKCIGCRGERCKSLRNNSQLE
jgi:uncharacterized protein YneF (UPF0154 family)